MGILVKNKKGHRLSPACSCNTFLCHWKNYTNKRVAVCSLKGCTEKKDLVGAHVIKCHGNSSNKQYIIPLCKKHNNPANTDCLN